MKAKHVNPIWWLGLLVGLIFGGLVAGFDKGLRLMGAVEDLW